MTCLELQRGQVVLSKETKNKYMYTEIKNMVTNQDKLILQRNCNKMDMEK